MLLSSCLYLFLLCLLALPQLIYYHVHLPYLSLVSLLALVPFELSLLKSFQGLAFPASQERLESVALRQEPSDLFFLRRVQSSLVGLSRPSLSLQGLEALLSHKQLTLQLGDSAAGVLQVGRSQTRQCRVVFALRLEQLEVLLGLTHLGL